MLCAAPVSLENLGGGIVPCGRCRHCRSKRKNEKAARIFLEDLHQEHCLFVTLTYSDEFLPREIYDFRTGEVSYAHPLGCLDKRAIQLFNKRLLRKCPPRSIRFFCVGEYGERRGRPHYHLIIWGLPIEKKNFIFESWTDPATGKLMCDPDYIDIQVPADSHAVGRYVAKYVQKRMTSPDDGRLSGRSPEFWLSSKGIGLAAVEHLLPAFNSVQVRSEIARTKKFPAVLQVNGTKLPIDRYMKNKILEKMQYGEEIKAGALRAYGEEMLALSARAAENPKITRQAYELSRSKMSYERWSLVQQSLHETAQQRMTFDRKADLLQVKKGEF